MMCKPYPISEEHYSGIGNITIALIARNQNLRNQKNIFTMTVLPPLKILMVYYHPGKPQDMRVSITHHLYALDSSPVKHQIVYYNAYRDRPTWNIYNINNLSPAPPHQFHDQVFDVVILHTTFLCLRWAGWYFYACKKRFRWIGELDCVKVALPQDEYDHAEILDEWLCDWGVHIVFSCFGEEQQASLYPRMRRRAKFYQGLTGYIDEVTARIYRNRLEPLNTRAYDLIYRARHLPYWFGSVGQMKHRLADVIKDKAQAVGLKCNISTRADDAIVGDSWLDFMSSGKAVLGMESGSSVVDWRGEVQVQVKRHLALSPDLTFDDFSKRMPNGWDSQAFLAVSPRHFEAVIMKTCQLLIEGEYNGIFVPEQHYIPIRSDFSNVDEALEKLRDNQYAQQIVERAYQDIYLSGKFTTRAFAEQLEEAILMCIKDRQSGQVKERAVNDVQSILEQRLIAGEHQIALLQAQNAALQQRSPLLWLSKRMLIAVAVFAFLANVVVSAVVSALIVAAFK